MSPSDRSCDPDNSGDASEPSAESRPANPAEPFQYRRVVDPDELARRLLVHEWVVDVRPRAAFAAAHLPKALNFELGSSFGLYLNRLYEWGSPLTLIAQSAREAEDARGQLRERGIRRIVGAAIGSPEELAGGRPLNSYPVTDYAGLAAAIAAHASMTVVDVRSDEERERGGVRRSLHVPIQRLLASLKSLPQGEVWVYSGSGYRAAIAASMLARAGRRPVLINGHYGNAVSGAAALGLTAARH